MAANFSKLDLPKLTADAAKYPNAGIPIERMAFWSNLETRLHELHQMPDGDVAEKWLSELEYRKITPMEDQALPSISQQVIDACVKDRQPIPEVNLLSSSEFYLCKCKYRCICLSIIFINHADQNKEQL